MNAVLDAEEMELWHKIKDVTERAINTAYGTDPRHGLLACAVANEVMQDIPMPWDLSKQFGRV